MSWGRGLSMLPFGTTCQNPFSTCLSVFCQMKAVASNEVAPLLLVLYNFCQVTWYLTYRNCLAVVQKRPRKENVNYKRNSLVFPVSRSAFIRLLPLDFPFSFHTFCRNPSLCKKYKVEQGENTEKKSREGPQSRVLKGETDALWSSPCIFCCDSLPLCWDTDQQELCSIA